MPDQSHVESAWSAGYQVGKLSGPKDLITRASVIERKPAALEGASRIPVQYQEFELEKLHNKMREAQTLRSKYIAQQVSRLWRQLRTALGLDGASGEASIEQAKAYIPNDVVSA